LVDRGLKNYWGYNPFLFFVPTARYAILDPILEFQQMVKALHAAEIEVIVDVVFNHTAEGNHLGPMLSLKGLDNPSYYRLAPEDRKHYFDVTGCGNTVHMANLPALRLVLDALRYWVEVFQVDGFRFDLGTALGREGSHFDPNGSFFDAIRQDPLLSRVKLIAEPWDLGMDGYQVGNFPIHSANGTASSVIAPDLSGAVMKAILVNLAFASVVLRIFSTTTIGAPAPVSIS